MKRISIFLLYLCLVLTAFTSCSKSDSDESAERETIDFSWDNVPTVTADSVYVNETMFPWNIVTTDSCLIIASSKTDTVLYMYSLPDLSFKKGGLTIGNGPAEIPNVNFYSISWYKDNMLAVPTMLPGNFVVVDAQDLQPVFKETFSLPKEWGYTQNIYPATDNTVLVQQGYIPFTWAIIDRNGKPFFEMEPDVPQSIREAEQNDEFMRLAINTGFATCNRDKELFAIGYRAFPAIDIYDYHGKIVRRQILPYNYVHGKFWLANISSTDSHIYLNMRNAEDDDSGSYMIVMDWSGNITGSYHILRKMSWAAVNESNSTCYYIDADQNDYIYYFKMNTHE